MNTQDQLIRAVQVATRKLASTGNFDLLMKDVLAICVEAVGASGGTIYLHDAAKQRLAFQHVLPEEIADKLPFNDIADDFGIAGQVFQTRKTVTREFPEKPEAEWNPIEKATGVPVRSMVTTPLMMEDEQPIGVVQLLNKEGGPFTDADVAVLDTVAAVATMAYFNYRLTEEASRASTLLGMGKVSHDIGNLAASLYATVYYSEDAIQALKEEVANDQSTEVGKNVLALSVMFQELKHSVNRIVGYSHLISDMSAGRELRPSKTGAKMASTIQTAAAYLATQARSNKVSLRYEIDDDAPATLHDELYVFRIVQNLVGNAIKAVGETVPDQLPGDDDDETTCGDVVVRYRYEEEKHIIEVKDTGPGMTQDVADRIRSGTARSMWDKGSGSGWGMKIVRELAATHGAEVEIDSKVGEGSTFRLQMPHVPE